MLKRLTLSKVAFNITTRRVGSMAWYCSGSTNSELVENLFKEGLIKNERVKEAMMKVSRNYHKVTYNLRKKRKRLATKEGF